MSDTTKKVNIELELDTNIVNSGVNPYQNLVWLARTLDAWRVFPRAFIGVYIVILYQVVNWFMVLPEPNIAQSGLVSVVVGAGAAWFGLYVNYKGETNLDTPPQQIVVPPSNPSTARSTPLAPGPVMPPSDNRG